MKYIILTLILLLMPIKISSADMVSNGNLTINGKFIYVLTGVIVINQFLLLENGSFLLLEDGGKVIL